MLRIRMCEESFVDPILSGAIRCPVHLSVGHEAIATGVCAALDRNDTIFGTHRSHSHYLAKGGDMHALVAEVYGKESGCSGGRGGSMHVLITDKGYLASTPIVAGTISLAVGSALAATLTGDNRVTVSFFGDGATGEGALYESLNFAALKKLPILFVCENNLYSTHMPIRECRPLAAPIHEIAKPFGISSSSVDGNDVLAVYESAKNAIEHCRRGNGPVFLEALTYRFRGHVGPDDNVQGEHTDIRPQEEIDEWRARDPVTRFAAYMKEQHISTERELEQLASYVEAEVSHAHASAHESPHPLVHHLTHHVFR